MNQLNWTEMITTIGRGFNRIQPIENRDKLATDLIEIQKQEKILSKIEIELNLD